MEYGPKLREANENYNYFASLLHNKHNICTIIDYVYAIIIHTNNEKHRVKCGFKVFSEITPNIDYNNHFSNRIGLEMKRSVRNVFKTNSAQFELTKSNL